MKKLKLELDALSVESFEADAREGRIGTVAAYDFTLQCGGTDLCTVSCNGTCDASCGGISCAGTCPAPCDSGGFYSECCSIDCTPACTAGQYNTACCDPTVDHTCGEACG